MIYHDSSSLTLLHESNNPNTTTTTLPWNHINCSVNSLVDYIIDIAKIDTITNRTIALDIVKIMFHHQYINLNDKEINLIKDSNTVIFKFTIFTINQSISSDLELDDTNVLDLTPTIDKILGYNQQIIRLPSIPSTQVLLLKSVVLHGIPFSVEYDDNVWFELYKPLEDTAFFSTHLRAPIYRVAEDYMIWTSVNTKSITRVTDDFKIQFVMKSRLLDKKEKLFHIWLNTRFFIPNDDNNHIYKLFIDKPYIDGARKDTHAKTYPDHMCIELTFASSSLQTYQYKTYYAKVPLLKDSMIPNLTKWQQVNKL